MKAFIESNPGLKSRFNKFFEFPDYTVDELQAIFMMQCKKYQYKMTEEAEAAVKEEIKRLEAAKGENFANAREVRNLFEKIITNQAARVAVIENVDEEMLTTLTIDDLKDLDDLEDPEKKSKEIEENASAAEKELLDTLTDILESSEQSNSEGSEKAPADEKSGDSVKEKKADADSGKGSKK
jgi:hypothetical protein